MSLTEYKGRSADDIASDFYIADSAWHIRACLSWRDYAEQKNAPMALHYAGFHLRTGIEHLWFEVFFAASGGSITSSEYDKSLRNTTKLYKLIDAVEPHYKKYVEFGEVIASIDSVRHPPSVFWDISRLKRIHGGCGEYLMHFQGVPEKGYLGSEWIEGRMKFLFDSAMWIWTTMTQRGNLVVYAPEGLKKPEVYSLWERYRDGKVSREDALIGLKIIQPIVRLRPHNQLKKQC
jgi:hypothetical protein